MNSQFKNSKIGTLLYIFIISIVVIVTVLIFWFMLFGYKIGTYSEDTILGSVYLGGLQQSEVNAKINDKYVDWLDDETIVYELTYQGYSYEFDRELFSFNIELSMEYLIDGRTNELYVNYQETSTDRQDTMDEISSLPFLQGIIDNVDVESIINDILSDAGKMKTYSLKRVEDYLLVPENSITVLSSDSMVLPDGTSGNDIVNGLIELYGSNVIVASSKELYSVVEELGDVLSEEQMTVLSRLMLSQLLETNFSIHELHYDPLIDFSVYNLENYPFKGSNAVINTTTDKNFSFYNPNNSDYMFTVTYDQPSDTITVTLSGLPFVDDIEVILHETVIEHAVKSSTLTDPTPGHDGLVVVVQRVITNIDGDVIYDNDIVFEFYQPVVEIIAGS